MCNVNDYVNYAVYTIDKFHIQWCLYPVMDIWNIINERFLFGVVFDTLCFIFW